MDFSYTPLILAIDSNRLDVARELLKNGANDVVTTYEDIKKWNKHYKKESGEAAKYLEEVVRLRNEVIGSRNGKNAEAALNEAEKSSI